MAKIVKLVDRSSRIVYPATITSAIIDLQDAQNPQDLATIISNINTQFAGLKLVKDNSLKYHLENVSGTKLGVDIDISQDTFLDDVNYVTNYLYDNVQQPVLQFIFNTASGKSDIIVPISALVNIYTADESTLTLNSNNQFSVKSGVFASSAQGTKADTALQSISKGTDGTYVTTTVGSKTSNSQTVGVSVTTQAVSSADSTHKGLAEASDVKSYVDTQVGNKNVTAESTTTGQITASASNNKVTVAAVTTTVSNSSSNVLSAGTTTGLLTGAAISTINTSINNKITTAINALDATPSKTGTNVTVGVTQTDGKLTAVSVSETYATVTAGNGEGSAATLSVATTNNTGLVKGTDITKVINYVDQKISGANSDLSDLQEEVEANTAAIEVINGSDTTAGSIAKALKDAKAYTDSKKVSVVKGNGINVTANTGATQYTVAADLVLAYTAASGNNGATITLKNAAGTATFGTINVSDIVGNGVLKSSSYSKTTGQLTLTFSSATGTDNVVTVDLSALLDINDVAIASASQKYLEVTLATTPSSDNESSQQAVFGAKIVNPSAATSTSTGLADAYQVKSYVDTQVGNKNVTAESTTTGQITASAANNKVTVAAVTTTATGTASALSAASTTGLLTGAAISQIKTYIDGKSSSAASTAVNALDATVNSTGGSNVAISVVETNGKLTSATVSETYATVTAGSGTGSGATLTVDSTNNTGLVKGTDIAKVITYVNEKVSGASSASDTAIQTAINALDATLSKTGTNVTVGVTQTDGKLTAVSVSENYSTISTTGSDRDIVLNIANGTRLIKGNDLSKVVDYINGQLTANVYCQQLSDTEYADISSYFS